MLTVCCGGTGAMLLRKFMRMLYLVNKITYLVAAHHTASSYDACGTKSIPWGIDHVSWNVIPYRHCYFFLAKEAMGGKFFTAMDCLRIPQDCFRSPLICSRLANPNIRSFLTELVTVQWGLRLEIWRRAGWLSVKEATPCLVTAEIDCLVNDEKYRLIRRSPFMDRIMLHGYESVQRRLPVYNSM